MSIKNARLERPVSNSGRRQANKLDENEILRLYFIPVYLQIRNTQLP